MQGPKIGGFLIKEAGAFDHLNYLGIAVGGQQPAHLLGGAKPQDPLNDKFFMLPGVYGRTVDVPEEMGYGV